jgi:RimJ/RimL family protein N-acetyltransferase
MSDAESASNRAVVVRRLTPQDAPAYRTLRLASLASTPEAFASSYEEEIGFSDETFRQRAAPADPGALFGGFAGAELVGMAGFIANRNAKQRHIGMLVGVFVDEGWRGAGLGARLVQAVLDHAARHVLLVTTTVVAENRPARDLYRRLGFEPYGLQRKALHVGGRYLDEELLALYFAAREASR